MVQPREKFSLGRVRSASLSQQPHREPLSTNTAARATDAGVESPRHVQRFLSAYGPIAQHFRPRRHRWSAPEYRQEMRTRCQMWEEITCTRTTA